MSSQDFLQRLKMKVDLEACCPARAQRENSEKRPTTELEVATENIQEEFAVKAKVFAVPWVHCLPGGNLSG